MAKKKSFRERMTSVLTTINSDTFHIGFTNVDKWISFGNFAMNRIMSGRFDRGLLFGREYILYGESGSGKSLMAAYLAADAQRQHNAYVVWLDIEHANDDAAGKAWLERAGVDISDDNFLYLSMASLEDIKKTISTMAVQFRDGMKEGETDLQPVVFVVDSWAAAMTGSQIERMESGELVGDQGQKAKQTGDVVLAVNHLCSGIPIMCIGVHHVYDNQDMGGRKHKTSGGNKAIYMASGCLLLTKKELTDDNVENQEVAEHYKELSANMTAEMKKKMRGGKRTVGITAIVENIKSRVSKPFERIEVQIPYMTGLDPYSGLFELLFQEGIVTSPSSGWYAFTDATGKEVKFRKSEWREHADAAMALAKDDISTPDAKAAPVQEEEAD